MLIINEYEVCPHRSVCPYNIHHTCNGAKGSRDTKFHCEYYINGSFVENGCQRLVEDKTGKMQVLME
jgi:hypothetical protein